MMDFFKLADRLVILATEVTTEPEPSKVPPPVPYHATDTMSDKHPDCWIDKGGKIWNVGKGGHVKFANWWIYERHGKESLSWDQGDVAGELEEEGWVHVSSYSPPTMVIFKKPLTGKQKDAIYDWMSAAKVTADFDCPGFSGKLSLEGFLEKFAVSSLKIRK